MRKIQILGIGCRKTQALKANLLDALEYLCIDGVIEEVTGVDEIVRYRISSIPALLIDGQVVFQGTVPSVEDILKSLEKYAPVSAAAC